MVAVAAKEAATEAAAELAAEAMAATAVAAATEGAAATKAAATTKGAGATEGAAATAVTGEKLAVIIRIYQPEPPSGKNEKRKSVGKSPSHCEKKSLFFTAHRGDR